MILRDKEIKLLYLVVVEYRQLLIHNVSEKDITILVQQTDEAEVEAEDFIEALEALEIYDYIYDNDMITINY